MNPIEAEGGRNVNPMINTLGPQNDRVLFVCPPRSVPLGPTIATTTRFRAATSGAGMGSPLGLYGVDQYIFQYDNELGPPWKNPETYIKLGYPLLHADRIKTPTLFMGGDQDFNVPLSGGQQMYQALRSLNVPTELIVYPGQFHGFTRPSFIRDRYQRYLDWYDKYLMPK